MAIARWVDPIVEEVRQWRKEVMVEADNDLDTLVDRLRERQEARGGAINLQTISPSDLRERIRSRFPDVSI
ncbi:MAG: hypothetical protein AAB353_06045 [Candidatus Hydrogenedentota bacterium]